MSTQILTGHDSAVTAYVVEDYPYGFRLRTSIRYWIETRPGYGQRFMSQTLNPKTGRWNKPKASTYNVLMIMHLDAQEHVTYATPEEFDLFRGDEGLDRFEAAYSEAFGNYEREAIRYLRARNRADKRVTWTVKPYVQGDPVQTLKEQAQLYGAVVRDELWRESEEARRG